jgi:hypothetical protein
VTVERKTLRCRVAEALRGRTRAGQNVRANRVDPIVAERELQSSDVHASLMVYTLAETVTVAIDSPRTYERSLELAVELYVEQGPELDADAVEDLVDDVCDQVECVVEPLIPQLLRLEVPGAGLLEVNPSRSGLTRVEVGFDARGVQLAGAARLVFSVAYGTTVDEREQAQATDLEGARVRYRFPPLEEGGDLAAEDAIDLPPG